MHTKKPTVAVARERYADYQRNAEGFAAAAESEGGNQRWNAAGLLYVHAAIARCDAVTIYFGGKKSSGSNHSQAASLLSEVVTRDPVGKKSAVAALRSIINQKAVIAYTGDAMTKNDIAQMAKQFALFSKWCEKILK